MSEVWIYPDGEKQGWRAMERLPDGTTRPITSNDWRDYRWIEASMPDDPADERTFRRGPRRRD